ncbi:MAG: ABC transporter permease [Chloroflexi bacterium]|jgi:peptide/nickel transport system permease protein|nr:ABC transporter permease [Chloroflexota bacterium]
MKRFFESEFFYNYRKSFSAVFGSVIIFLALVIGLIGPFVVPQNPYDQKQTDLSNAYLPPMWEEEGRAEFPLGTDGQGRDMLSVIVYGSRISLLIGISVTVISCVIGTFLGVFAGYKGGKTDSFIMRVADIQLSFPSMLIALFIMAIFGSGIEKLIVTLSFVGWVMFARTIRGETLSVKNQEYIQAAHVLGYSDWRILFRHVLPNVTTPLIVLFTNKIGNVILTEASLSFLGVGVPVTQPSLGLLVKNGFDVLFSGLWWVSLLPGLYIMLLVFGINLLGDFLKDELNPQLN